MLETATEASEVDGGILLALALRQESGGQGETLLLGAPPPTVSQSCQEGAGWLAAAGLLPEAAVESAQVHLGLGSGERLWLGLGLCGLRVELENLLLEVVVDGLCHQVVDGCLGQHDGIRQGSQVVDGEVLLLTS